MQVESVFFAPHLYLVVVDGVRPLCGGDKPGIIQFCCYRISVNPLNRDRGAVVLDHENAGVVEQLG